MQDLIYNMLTAINKNQHSENPVSIQPFFLNIHNLSLFKVDPRWSFNDIYNKNHDIYINHFKSHFHYAFNGSSSEIQKDLLNYLSFDNSMINQVVDYFVQTFKNSNKCQDIELDNDFHFKEFQILQNHISEKIYGFHDNADYYARRIKFGTYLNSHIIFLQYLFFVENENLKVKAKICFPISENNCFSVFICEPNDIKLACEIIFGHFLNDMRKFLYEKYPLECADIFDVDDNTIKLFLDLVKMDNI